MSRPTSREAGFLIEIAAEGGSVPDDRWSAAVRAAMIREGWIELRPRAGSGAEAWHLTPAGAAEVNAAVGSIQRILGVVPARVPAG